MSTVYSQSLKNIKDSLLTKSGLGVGQTWQDVILLRTTSINYVNETVKPIAISALSEGVTSHIVLYINDVLIDSELAYRVEGSAHAVQAIIPVGASYRVEILAGSAVSWLELR